MNMVWWTTIDAQMITHKKKPGLEWYRSERWLDTHHKILNINFFTFAPVAQVHHFLIVTKWSANRLTFILLNLNDLIINRHQCITWIMKFIYKIYIINLYMWCSYNDSSQISVGIWGALYVVLVQWFFTDICWYIWQIECSSYCFLPGNKCSMILNYISIRIDLISKTLFVIQAI